MDKLKKFFPTAFMFLDDVGKFILGLVIHFAAGVVIGLILGIPALLIGLLIPFVGFVFSGLIVAVAGLVGLYLTACMTISIVVFIMQNNQKKD